MNLESLLTRRFPSGFYSQPTVDVARQLIGQYFIVNRNGQLKIIQITETEAYAGEDDLASHARFGQTRRNSIMWGPPGHLYVYLIYGIHYLMNVITQPVGSPSAVLIRGGAIIPDLQFSTSYGPGMPGSSITKNTISGPARLTKYLNINLSDLNHDLTTSSEIFISSSNFHPQIITTPRIGINYAPQPWRSIPWRFVLDKQFQYKFFLP